MSPFDIINRLCDKTEHILDDNRTEAAVFEQNQKDLDRCYFIINRFFSKYPDTVYLANAANSIAMTQAASSSMRYDVYYYGTEKKKRFAKWAKSDADLTKTLDAMVFVFSCSRAKAVQYLKLLTDEQVASIVKYFEEVHKAK